MTENESKNKKYDTKYNGKIDRQLYIKWIIGVAVCFIILIILSVGFFVLADHMPQQDPTAPTPISEKLIADEVDTTTIVTSMTTDKETCRTRKCIDLATRLTENMNPDVKPCDDFYEHACGRFSKNFSYRVGHPPYGVGSRFYKLMQERVEGLLSSDKKHNSSSVEFVKKFYKSCVAEPISQSAKPLFDHASKLFGGFPLMDPNWTDDKFDINNALKIVLNEKVEALLHVKMPSRSVENKLILTAFKQKNKDEVMDLIEKLLNGILSETDIENYKKEYNSFHKKYKKAVDKMKKKNNETLSISEMDRLVPGIKWSEIIKSTFPSDVKYDPLDHVIVSNLASSINASVFNKFLTETPKKDLANYLIVNYVNQKAGLIYGRDGYSYDCAEQSLLLFPRITLSMYMEKYFDMRVVEKIRKIYENVRVSYREMLNTSQYLDSGTKGNLTKKLDTLGYNVLVPDQSYKELDDEVRMLNIEGKDYLEKVTEIEKWRTKLINDMAIRKPNVKYLQEYTAEDYYNSKSMNIFLAFIDYPIFETDAPDYLIYGTVGSTIGHEIGYGFDIDYHLKKITKHQDTNYWSKESKEEYDKRAKCLVDQFDGIEWTGFDTKANGSQTIRENQADNMGMKTSFAAFRKLNPTIETSQMPRLEQFTEDQLFYYGAALMDCERPPTSNTVGIQETDVHAFGKFRVNAYKNQPEFAKAFNCASETFMNPVEKCSVF